MKTFLFLLLAGCAVRCDDSNYYVVQMPDLVRTKDFKVYWNVPTMQCKSKKIYFNDLYEKYGIIQNTGDTFRGDQISILYDPGDFPALLRNSSSGEIRYRNGGVPQEGDLIEHLDTFQKVLEQSIPDKEFSGIGIIDFESWKPVLRQNFGILTPYKDVSYEIERKRHWWWKKQWIEEEAKRRFEIAGRDFMQATVTLAKKMRPLAVWGYYGYPYCFNMAANNRKESCADKVPQENDGISWLWKESTALYPSVYSSNDITSKQLSALIRGRVKEAARLRQNNAPILPYFWYRYRDKGYFNKSDLNMAFNTFYKSNASGFIIWGSSNDVNTVEKCQKLKKYVRETLGPAVAKYTKQNIVVRDEADDIYNVVFNPNNASQFDPEYTWIPPVNYTENIERMVDKELQEEEEAAFEHKDIHESKLVDIILRTIANYCAEGCDNKSKVKWSDGDGSTNESRVVLVTDDPFKKHFSTVDVTVPTTITDNIYDYDINAGEQYQTIPEDIEDLNDYSDTSGENEEKNSTIIVISEKESDEVKIVRQSNSESIISTTEIKESYPSTEQNKEIDTSTEEIRFTESVILESSTTSANSLEISGYSTTESATRVSTEQTSTIEDNFNLYESITEFNSTESKTDSSTEESSTIISSTIVYSTLAYSNSTITDRSSTEIDLNESSSTTIEYSITTTDSSISSTTESSSTATESSSTTTESSSTTTESSGATTESSGVGGATTESGSESDSSTTLAPVYTEQVVVSVV